MDKRQEVWVLTGTLVIWHWGSLGLGGCSVLIFWRVRHWGHPSVSPMSQVMRVHCSALTVPPSPAGHPAVHPTFFGVRGPSRQFSRAGF